MPINLDNPQLKDALHVIQFTSNSLFLTGKAGTGKSTFLKYICGETKKEHVVLAPTGIAAINVGGATLHSFFKLPFQPFTPDDPNYSTTRKLRSFLKYDNEHVKLIKKLELVIIDEISMVRADVIDFIDRILRVYSGNMRLPFGGKQMLFVGDVFQLEPVVTRDERDIISRFYESPYFFSAHVFRQMQLVSVELTTVYRQTDRAFIGILDHIRQNLVTNADLQLLDMRVDQNLNTGSEPDDSFTITLATRRDVVDEINQRNLNNIESETFIFTGEVNGDFPENALPTAMSLELKVGAQVIFVKNDKDKRWVNGTVGMVEGVDIEGKCIYVVTDEGDHFDVTREIWENVRYKYNEEEKKIEEDLLGTFTQFPVKLAWAITIHKSQGLTFNKVNIDLTGGAFVGGQTYVALSRCRSLDGIKLKQGIRRSDIFINPFVVSFARTFNDSMAVQKALKTAEADIRYKEAVEAFDRGDFQACLDHFFVAIHARYDIEKPLPRRFIRRKLGIINAKDREADMLRDKIADLKSEIKKKDKIMAELAKEYVQMGDECVKLESDQAALANYEKAVHISPSCTDAMVGKARVLLSQRQLRKALNAINKALKLQPHKVKILFWHAKVLFAMDKLDEAMNDLERCTSLKPDSITSHELYGDVLTAAGDDVNAAIHYAIAEQLKKNAGKK